MAIYRMLLLRWAPLVYLVTVLPATIFAAYLTPLFQIPGEDATFLQAVAALNQEAGGAGRLVEALKPLPANPAQRIDAAALSAARELPWMANEPGQTSAPPATARAPVFFTVPAALALKLGRGFGARLFDSAVAARLADAVVAVGLGALALGMALHGRALLFVLLSLPMAEFLSGGIVPDGVMMASVALVIGLCSRATGGGRPLGIAARLSMGVLIGAAVATRPAYAPLLLLLLTDAVRPARPRSSGVGFLIAIAPLCLAGAIVAAWMLRMGLSVGVPHEAIDTAWLNARIADLRQGLPIVWERLRTTVLEAGLDPLRAFVGALGLGGTPIPTPVFIVWVAALALAAVMASFEEGNTLSLAGGLALAAIFVFAAALVFLLPPSETPPEGAGGMAAQQGRHLLPIATVLALALPGLIGARGRYAYSGFGNVVSTAGWLAIFALAAISGWMVLPPVLLGRFYL